MMESANSAIADSASPTVTIPKATKRRRSVEERRRMVEASLSTGATIAAVAARHGIRPNQLSAWRKLYREGRLRAEGTAAPLLPVKLVRSGLSVARTKAAGETRWPGQIELELAQGQVRIAGQVPAD